MTVKEFRDNVTFLLGTYESLYQDRKKKRFCFRGLCDCINELWSISLITEDKKDILFQTIEKMGKFRYIFLDIHKYSTEFYYVNYGNAFLFSLIEKKETFVFIKRLLYSFFEKPNSFLENNAVQARIDFMNFILSLSDEDIESEL